MSFGFNIQIISISKSLYVSEKKTPQFVRSDLPDSSLNPVGADGPG